MRICHPSQKTLDAAFKKFTSFEGKGMYAFSTMSVRTDTIHHFVQDFFFPRVIHLASKTHNLVLRILVSIAYAAIDLVTFPVRCITLLLGYRAEFPIKKDSHPLFQYLQNIVSRLDIYSEEQGVRLLSQIQAIGILTVSVTPNPDPATDFSAKIHGRAISLTGEHVNINPVDEQNNHLQNKDVNQLIKAYAHILYVRTSEGK